MRKLSVVFSSHLSDEENNQFIQHLKETAETDIHVECIVNKKQYSLPEAYNLAWSNLDKISGATNSTLGNNIIVFCHNDIKIRTKGWDKILLHLFEGTEYDILGIAGTDVLHKHGCWWLSENGNAMNTARMFGRVWHTNGIREYESVYSKKIQRVKDAVLVDGLFIAVDGNTVVNRFNEKFKGFHYYDLSFCIDNFLDGNNIGIIDKVSVLHMSMGATNAEWEENRKQFAEEYQEYLPLTI